MSEEYKTETKRTYDLYAESFDQEFDEHFKAHVQNEADIFIKELSGKKILDLGCGAGTHALYFKKQGFDVLCADISEKMLTLCRKKGLDTQIVDIENITLPKESFDGVWAYTSLLHIPKKSIEKVITEIASLLKPHGIFGLAVKEGTQEQFETNKKYPNTKRWFTYFTEDEIRKLLAPHFDILYCQKTNVKDKYVFLNYVARKK